MEAFIFFNCTVTVLWTTAFLPIAIRERRVKAVVLSTLGMLIMFVVLIPNEKGLLDVLRLSISFTVIGFAGGVFMCQIGKRKDGSELEHKRVSGKTV